MSMNLYTFTTQDLPFLFNRYITADAAQNQQKSAHDPWSDISQEDQQKIVNAARQSFQDQVKDLERAVIATLDPHFSSVPPADQPDQVPPPKTDSAETSPTAPSAPLNLSPTQPTTLPHWTLPEEPLNYPKKVMLAFLRDGRLRLKSPIEVTISQEDGQTVANAGALNEYGAGNNQTEAIADLQRAIADLYFTLAEDQDRLGKKMQKVWEDLQSKISRQ